MESPKFDLHTKIITPFSYLLVPKKCQSKTRQACILVDLFVLTRYWGVLSSANEKPSTAYFWFFNILDEAGWGWDSVCSGPC
jgi:hypothetical protein